MQGCDTSVRSCSNVIRLPPLFENRSTLQHRDAVTRDKGMFAEVLDGIIFQTGETAVESVELEVVGVRFYHLFYLFVESHFQV